MNDFKNKPLWWRLGFAGVILLLLAGVLPPIEKYLACHKAMHGVDFLVTECYYHE